MTHSSAFIVLLLVLVSFAVASPSRCAGKVNALEVGNEAEISEVGVLAEECDPNSTCTLKCKCGKLLYFDMSKHRKWRYSSTQRIWRQYCSKKISVTNFVSNEINKAAQSLVNSKRKGFASRIRSRWEKIVIKTRIVNLLGGVFKKIYKRYKQLCHGGKRIGRIQMWVLKTVFKVQLAFRSFAFKRYPNFKQLKKHAKAIFKRFVDRINSGGFEYCDCTGFLKRTSYLRYLGAKMSCVKACRSSTLEFETESDEYMEE
eukprot:gene2354-2822_t